MDVSSPRELGGFVWVTLNQSAWQGPFFEGGGSARMTGKTRKNGCDYDFLGRDNEAEGIVALVLSSDVAGGVKRSSPSQLTFKLSTWEWSSETILSNLDFSSETNLSFTAARSRITLRSPSAYTTATMHFKT